MGEYGGLGLFFLVALIFPVSALIPAFLLQPRQPTKQKRIPYECGVDTEGKTYVQYRVGYFLYALVFIVFDIETVFLYPWAVRFGHLGLFALIEMFIFIGILAVGLGYAWKKGALSSSAERLPNLGIFWNDESGISATNTRLDSPFSILSCLKHLRMAPSVPSIVQL